MKNNLPPGLQQLLILPEFSGIMNIDSLVQNFPGCGGVNIHQAACYCGFPGTGFPYQSQNLAFINLKRNIIDCVNSDFPGKRKAVPSDFLLRSKFLYSISFPPTGGIILGALLSSSHVAAEWVSVMGNIGGIFS